MSTENRVESSLSAVVARRSPRPSLDSFGMGFQEELLSLTFESKTDFPVVSPTTTNNPSSDNQDESYENNDTLGNEYEQWNREREQQVFALPFPAPQRPIADTPSPTSDSEITAESPRGSELANGSKSGDQINSKSDRLPSDPSAQSNDLRTEAISNKPGLPRTATQPPDGHQTSISAENQLGLPKQSTADQKTSLNQSMVAADETGPLIDSQTTLVKREPRKSIRNQTAGADRASIEQNMPVQDESKFVADRVVPIEENATSQDSLPYEQDTAPTRTRRVSRQDRIRDDKNGEASPGPLESKPSKEKDVAAKTLESSSQIVDASSGSSQHTSVVAQIPSTGPLETSFTVAGQPNATQSETLVVSGASNSGAASATLTAAIAGTADRGITSEGPVQPIVAGTGRGEALGGSGRGTGRSEGATGSSTLSRFQQTKLLQRVLKGFEQLSNGGGQVKLRLHPPELGTLQLTLKIEANVMSAHLDVENSLAKDALLNNLQSLRDRLSDQGISIDRFEVEVRTDSQSGAGSSFGESASNRQSRRDQPESRYAIYNENRLANEGSSEGKPSVSWFRTTGKLDLSV